MRPGTLESTLCKAERYLTHKQLYYVDVVLQATETETINFTLQ
jgi:hypothetical protein